MSSENFKLKVLNKKKAANTLGEKYPMFYFILGINEIYQFETS